MHLLLDRKAVSVDGGNHSHLSLIWPSYFGLIFFALWLVPRVVPRVALSRSEAPLAVLRHETVLKLMKLTKLFSCFSSRALLPSEDQSTTSNKINDTNGPPLPSHAANSAKPAKSSKISENEPYSPERVTDLFDTYADADDASVIGADGFIQLCTDAGIAMEGSLPLLFHWLLNAEDMMKIQKSEWDKGMSELRYVLCIAVCIVAMTVFSEFPL